MEWADQYKSPNWQQKRLEVMQAAGFACVSCGDSEKQLHVHHRYYRKNTKVWEYPDDCYECLCFECHEIAGAVRESLKTELETLNDADLDRLVGYAKAINYDTDKANGENVSMVANSYYQVLGIANYFRLDTHTVLDMAIANNGIISGDIFK